MKRLLRTHLPIIGLYTLLTLILTWPVALDPATRVPGEATWAFDESTFLWNMWWFKFCLLSLGQTPLHSIYIFFPIGINLTTYTFNLFNAAIGLPFSLAFSMPLASNLVLLFSFVTSAYGTFLLSLYLLRSPSLSSDRAGLPLPRESFSCYLAAFAAGAVFAFSASRMMYAALGHYNFVTIQWFPFYTLFLLKTLRGGSARSRVMAGLFAAFCLYAELTYSVFLLILTLILAADAWRKRRAAGEMGVGPAVRFFLPGLLGIALVTLILIAPFVLTVLPNFLDPAYAEPGWGEGLKLSADLAGLFTPTPLHPLSGVDWLRELRAVIEGNGRFQDVNTLFLGYGIVVLALLGAWRWRAGRVWLWSALLFTVLSLGPLLTVNGQNRFNLDGLEVTFPLPFALLHYLPIINANRVPNRFGIPLTMALALLVGAGVLWLLERGQRSYPTRFTRRFLIFLYGLLMVLLLFDQTSVPLPTSDARIPDVYYRIGAEPENFTLMQLPLGWRNSYGTLGAERTQLQYYQAAHQRPMLGGNTSRNPAFKFEYYAQIPFFAALTETELYRDVDELTRQRARQQASELMTLYNIKYLVIHEPLPLRKPYEDTYPATRRLALDMIPHRAEPVYQSPGVQAFAVEQVPVPEPLVLDFGDWTSAPYRGEGWAGDEIIFAATANWATAIEAVIFFPVRGSGDRQLALQVAPFTYPGSPSQAVGLILNGREILHDLPLHEGWQPVEAVLPETALTPGLNRLSLRFAHTAQPRQVLPPTQAIGTTGVKTPVDLEVNSGPDFAFITAGFGPAAVDASAHRRGLNLAVLDARTGQVLDYKGFDTAANEFEAAALTEFIASVPVGAIVVVASQGAEATAYLNAEGQAALQALGLNTKNLAPPFSAIGVKGTPTGTALQVGGDSESTAYLRLGASADTRHLAAAVDQVLIRRP